MSLIPKPFHKLLDKTFIIPPYQRGYRWDSEQVETLLDDLFDFIRKYVKQNHNSDSNLSEPYYCLQPIAVVKDAPNRFIVVDGQQRLTTIYLLLHYLRNREDWDFPIYKLEMPNREMQDEYLKNETFRAANIDFTNNIDTFYIQKAYESIVNWFKKDSKRQQYKQDFRNLFAFEPEDDTSNRDVRVIWYEISSTTALAAFRRLNYGKIPLTSTELVKALLLKDESDTKSGEFSRGAAYRRALEWDSMEHTLHNPYLWSMLSSQSENSLSHMDLILDFVCDRLNAEMVDEETNQRPFIRKDSFILINKDVRDYFNYNVINEFMRRNGSLSDEDIWNRIRRTFNLIVNWYDNREWYHLIGLLRILSDNGANKNGRTFIRDIYKKSIDQNGKVLDRPEFTRRLIEAVGTIIYLPNNLTLDQLSYTEKYDRDCIIKILKTLNVYESIINKTEGNRFAFHLFEGFNVTSLEHIHPQNITTGSSFDDFKEWIYRRSADFEKLTEDDFIKVVKTLETATEEKNDTETLKHKAQLLQENIRSAIKRLKNLTLTKKQYADEDNKEMLEESAKELDKLFGDLSGISESELHSIANLALIDQPTNSALQNYFLDYKRDILMARHKDCDLKKKLGTYAPPATRLVFCKEYSRKSPGDMRLWRREDRINYFNAIKEAYDYFTTKKN